MGQGFTKEGIGGKVPQRPKAKSVDQLGAARGSNSKSEAGNLTNYSSKNATLANNNDIKSKTVIKKATTQVKESKGKSRRSTKKAVREGIRTNKRNARQATRDANKDSRRGLREKNRNEKDPTKRAANTAKTQKANAAARVAMRAKKKSISKEAKG